MSARLFHPLLLVRLPHTCLTSSECPTPCIRYCPIERVCFRYDNHLTAPDLRWDRPLSTSRFVHHLAAMRFCSFSLLSVPTPPLNDTSTAFSTTSRPVRSGASTRDQTTKKPQRRRLPRLLPLPSPTSGAASVTAPAAMLTLTNPLSSAQSISARAWWTFSTHGAA